MFAGVVKPTKKVLLCMEFIQEYDESAKIIFDEKIKMKKINLNLN